METVRVKSYAKLNLTLHVTGVKDGYHTLDSVVTSVDLYDLIVARKRRDNLVTIEMHGCGSESIEPEKNNAYLAAQTFVEFFSTRGANITVYKNIPMGLGLGGSSADAAGVLNALAKLYGVNDNAHLKILADGNGSDTRYMLNGGYARLGGRGDEVTPVDSRLKLDFLLLAPKRGISTAECYSVCDRTERYGGDSGGAVRAIENGDKAALSGCLVNDLFPAAKLLSADVARAYEELSEFDPLAVNMTGSGSGVYAVFENAEYCAYARSRYRGGFAAYRLKTKLL